MNSKMNIKFRPCEILALENVSRILGLKRNSLIRLVLFGPDSDSAGARSLIISDVVKFDDSKNIRITRVPISVRFREADLEALSAMRKPGHTISETVREKLGLRAISSWFTAAARASSRRKQRPVGNEKATEQYRQLLEQSARLNALKKGVV